MTLRYNTLMEETEILRGFATAIPAPVWARRANGTLAFANPAYAVATEATSSADAISRNLDLLDSPDRNEMARALSEQAAFAKRLPVVVRGERKIFDVQAIALRSGSAGIAIDASEAASLRASLSRMADAHRRTLDQLSSAVAVFDTKQRLTFYNESYRRLWNLDVAFLDTSPSDSAILDQLRATRKIPEQHDFRQWKSRLHEAYRATEARSDEWHLPDGRTLRVISTPNPEGGVTYLFDDATESLDLERQFDALIRVQRATLDNLAEAVAVFGSNGRARLFNPAFAKMWQLSPDALEQQPHIKTVQEWCAAAVRRRARVGAASRNDHRHRQPQLGGDADRAQGRQRPQLHDHAAARRRHIADVPGCHRYGECGARAARTQRSAGSCRPDEGELRPPRILRTALAADDDHRLCAFPQRSVHRTADPEAKRVPLLHHVVDQCAAGDHQQHPRPRHHRCRRDVAQPRPGRRAQGDRAGRGRRAGSPRHRQHPPRCRDVGRDCAVHRRRAPRRAGAVQSARQCRRLLSTGRNRHLDRDPARQPDDLRGRPIMARAFRRKARARCSTGSKPTPTARATAAQGSASRWSARSSRCMAARSRSNSAVGRGTTVTCEFPAEPPVRSAPE